MARDTIAETMAISHTSTGSDVVERMREASTALLDALSPGQRATASFDFNDLGERSDWAYFPRNHRGLPLREMDASQQKLAHALVAQALSLHAYGKVTAIMALESVLNLIEGRRLDTLRDPGRYFFSFFDRPGEDRWGWRLEGHHVSLNYTILDGELASATPSFLGANPAEVRHGEVAVTRPCGEEEDRARALLESLDDEQRRVAVICAVAPPDFVLMNLPQVPEAGLPGEATALPFVQRLFDEMASEHREALRFERARPSGLPASRMDAAQRTLLWQLVAVYLERLPEPLASLERAKIEGSGIDVVYFSWAGELERAGPHYYRLHGPSFLVEYDNTQDDANHVHAVWRNPDGDFGGDVLRRHLERAH